MNIFVLHLDPRVCARWHVDRHVVKMILETCQMLFACWHVWDPEHVFVKPAYKKTHVNHPCTRWARESKAHYAWLCALGRALCREYSHRYAQRTHRCASFIAELSALTPPIESSRWRDPPQAMEEAYKAQNAVMAYRRYYRDGKRHLHSWKGRPIPRFLSRATEARTGARREKKSAIVSARGDAVRTATASDRH